MKKDFLLILSIYEGRDWKPENGLNIIIEAKLDSHSSFTEPIALTNSPKFNSEITWQVEKQVIRSYKINRVPIKIEFYLVKENKKRLLGYLIIPLSSAVEGVEGDPKWHKLLGTLPGAHKTPPSVLLGIGLEAMTLDKKNMNNDQMSKNANPNSFLPAQLLNGRGFSSSITISKVPSAVPNGNTETKIINSHNQPTATMHSDAIHFDRANEVNKPPPPHVEDDGDVIAILSDDEDNDESEDYISEDGEEMDDIYQHSSPYVNGGTFPYQHFQSPRLLTPETAKVDTPKSTENTSKVNLDSSSKDESHLNQSNSEDKQLIESRETTRKNLSRLSKESFDTKLLNNSSLLNKSFEVREDATEKRLLESPSSSEAGLPASKSSRTEISIGAAASLTPEQVSNLNPSEFSSEHESRLSASGVDNSQEGPKEKLVAHLDESRGIFIIGSTLYGNEEEFEYSISVYGAKNLKQIVPEAIACENNGFQFCFSILGCPIYTEPFMNIEDPNFLVDKATAFMRATRENLAQFFTQHSILPFYLMSGEITLATCNLNLSKLSTGYLDKVVLNDSYELHPMALPVPSNSAENKAEIYVRVELERRAMFKEQLLKNNPSPLNADILSKVGKHSISGSDNESTSDSSYSDLDKHSNSFAKLLRRHPPKHRRSLKRNKTSKFVRDRLEEEVLQHKEQLITDAEQDIEEWKDKQCKEFMREFEMKEELLRKRIAADLSTKVKASEEDLKVRLRDCDSLYQRMLSSMNELHIREERIKERERKLDQEEKLLHKEKAMLQSSLDSQELSNTTKLGSFSREASVSQQLELDRTRRENLENRVSRLQDDLQKANERFSNQTREIYSLKKQLVKSDDNNSLIVANEILKEQLSTALERKQFYKLQWTKALDDLHKLHSAHKDTIENIIGDIRESSPEPVVAHHSRDEMPTSPLSHRRKKVSYNIGKLRDERKTLLSSGIYSPNNPLIKKIDDNLPNSSYI